MELFSLGAGPRLREPVTSLSVTSPPIDYSYAYQGAASRER